MRLGFEFAGIWWLLRQPQRRRHVCLDLTLGLDKSGGTRQLRDEAMQRRVGKPKLLLRKPFLVRRIGQRDQVFPRFAVIRLPATNSAARAEASPDTAVRQMVRSSNSSAVGS